MNSSNPFFSVVIPLYNKEAHVCRCINSVLSQTFKDFEVIVVDDGSSDNSYNLVKAHDDSRLRIIQQANAGVSAARNRGIEVAAGEWVTFLDADDEWFPPFLQKVYECAHAFPEAGVIYSVVDFIRDGKIMEAPPRNNESGPHLVVDYFAFTLLWPGQKIVSSAIAVRREAFKASGVFPVGVKIGEDKDTWHRLVWTAQIAHIPECLANIYLDAGDSGWQNATDWETRVSTYLQWRKAGRIPLHLQNSSALAHQEYVLRECIRMAMDGKRWLALKNLLRHTEWRYVSKRFLRKAIVRICFARSGKVRVGTAMPSKNRKAS